MNSIGKRIEAIRKSQAKSQTDVANESGLRPETISRIERGEVEPRRDTLERIALALKIDVSELLKGPEMEAPMGHAVPETVQAPRGVSNYIPLEPRKDGAVLKEALAIITLEKDLLTEQEWEITVEVIRKVLQRR